MPPTDRPPTDRPPADRPPGRPRLLPALAASLAIVVVWLVVVWLATAVTQAVRPPPCLGVGVGCEPDPSTATLLTGVVVGAPALALGWLATLAGWAVSGRAASPAARRWGVWAPPAVLAVAAGVHVVGATAAELLT
jgi:hypothetical protein